MESRVSYTAVGAFVVLLVAGLVYFVYWLGMQGDSSDYEHYRVYMNESVSGLSVDASVKYMGVAVGKVEKIMINPENSRQVELILRIKKGTPVTVDTTAQLRFFGITGLAFVELHAGSSQEPLRGHGEGEIPVIPSRPSALKRIDESLSVLASRSEEVLERIKILLSKENVDNFSGLLAGLRGVTRDVREVLPSIAKLADKTMTTEDELTGAARRVGVAADRVAVMADRLSTRYDALGIKLDRGIDRAVSGTESLFDELERLAIATENLVRRLEDSPSDILFRRRHQRPGPGEPGYVAPRRQTDVYESPGQVRNRGDAP